MTNREEVAKKLRETARTFDKEYPNGAKDWLDENAAFNQVDEIIGTDNNIPYAPFFSRLADLVDPTCEVVEVPDNDEFMIRVVSGFECKKCGHEAIVERNCGGWAEPPNYCPNCGARVVRDEA